MPAPEVSVVMPLYGRHRAYGTLRSVARAWAAQDVACEVIVAVAGDGLDGEDPGDVTVLHADASDGVRCKLLNLGARHARAPLLYFGDADIAPLGRDFVPRARAVAAGGVLAQPWIYRLLDVPDEIDVAALRPPPTGRHCFVTAAADGSLRPGAEEFTTRRYEHGEHVVDTPLVCRLPRPATVAGGVSADRVMPFHCGGLLIEAERFARLGGYCDGYVGWGGEDEDMLYKIAGTGELVRAWQMHPTLACAHFEHPRPYFGTPERAANQALYGARIAAGARAMVDIDVAAWSARGGP